jgi:DTW domain-containing protein YfiP
MNKLLESIRDSKRTSLLLFPDETAKTLEEIVNQKKSTCSTTEASLRDQPPERGNNNDNNNDNDDDAYDLIVLDGTWAQARKFHSRYFPPDNSSPSSSLQRVKLSEASVELLHNGSTESGHQLRRHEIPWRQVGTFEAFRLFLRDWSREFPSHNNNNNNNNNNNENDGRLEFWEQIESYQRIANEAALKELGPPRS